MFTETVGMFSDPLMFTSESLLLTELELKFCRHNFTQITYSCLHLHLHVTLLISLSEINMGDGEEVCCSEVAASGDKQEGSGGGEVCCPEVTASGDKRVFPWIPTSTT